MQVTSEVHQRVMEKLGEGVTAAEAVYNRKFDIPKVLYNVRGSTAGLALYHLWCIRLNAVLLMENVDAFIARTVPHELAHLITGRMYPETRRVAPGQKRDTHGMLSLIHI